MTVLVTGGAGFIGSNLVDELLTQGFDVTVLDNLSEGSLNNLSRWKSHAKLEFVKGDITDYELVRRVCDHKSWVFHLAAMSRIQPSISNPSYTWKQNIIGTANVLEACRVGDVKRVIYSASSSAYGLVNEPPLIENMKTDCLNPYSLSKKFGEELMKLYSELYGLSTISLRYFNVYGPRHQEEGQYATVIAIFRKQKRLGQKLTVVGDGYQRRDFTFVSDVVRANMMAAMAYNVNGVINIGTGTNYSINEIAEIIEDDDDNITHIEPRPAEARTTLASIEKAKDLLGWKPEVKLIDGLKILDIFEKNDNKKIILV